MANDIEDASSALNVRLDMAQVSSVLDQQPRLNVTLPSGSGDITLVEATRTMRPTPGGGALADNQVNVLC